METLEFIFKTYGFQSATVIAIISFFCTRYFGNKDKKLELRHNLFQKLKVESINNFLDCYASSELSLTQLPYYEILDHKITGKALDELVIPTHNKFMASYYKLFVVLDEKEMSEFTQIYNSIANIKTLLRQLMYNYPKGEWSDRPDTYISLVMDTEKQNKKRLRLIGEKFRSKYR